MLLVRGSKVSPAILEPKTLPLMDFGFPDLSTQLRLSASLTNPSLRRFSATSRMSLEVTLLFPGKACIGMVVPYSSSRYRHWRDCNPPPSEGTTFPWTICCCCPVEGSPVEARSGLPVRITVLYEDYPIYSGIAPHPSCHLEPGWVRLRLIGSRPKGRFHSRLLRYSQIKQPSHHSCPWSSNWAY